MIHHAAAGFLRKQKASFLYQNFLVKYSRGREKTMKNIKYGLIALTALVAGTGSAFAVSASTESTNIIIGEPVSLEEAAELTKTEHSGSHNPGWKYAKCPRCTIYNTDPTNTYHLGHCRLQRNNKVIHCSRRVGTTA